MSVALAGAGAFGEQRLDGRKRIGNVEIVPIISRTAERAARVAKKYGARQSSTTLADTLTRDDVDDAILGTPTQMHAEQAIACMKAGKHIQVEIPLANSLADAEAVRASQLATGLTCVVGCTRRINPSQQYVQARITSGQFKI